MRYPQKPTPSISSSPPRPVSVSEETLDQALDALTRGDRRGIEQLGRLDPALADSVSEVYELADLSGFAEDQSYPMPLMMERRRVGRPPTTRRRVMTTFATVAATVALALGLATAIPALIPDREREAATLEALDAPPVLDGTTEGAAADGTDETVADPEAREVATLSPDDCTAEPRPRDEVLEILSVAPAEDQLPTGFNEAPADQFPVAELNQVYREWQACTRFGSTLQTMALETPALIRKDIYGTWGAIERMANVEPYSEATLNEIIEGREAIDATELASYEEAGNFPVSILQIDESEPVHVDVATGGTWVTVDTVKINPGSNARYPRDFLFISFQLVDGRWLIADMDSIQLD